VRKLVVASPVECGINNVTERNIIPTTGRGRDGETLLTLSLFEASCAVQKIKKTSSGAGSSLFTPGQSLIHFALVWVGGSWLCVGPAPTPLSHFPRD